MKDDSDRGMVDRSDFKDVSQGVPMTMEAFELDRDDRQGVDESKIPDKKKGKDKVTCNMVLLTFVCFLGMVNYGWMLTVCN